jgi:hypothetical protein
MVQKGRRKWGRIKGIERYQRQQMLVDMSKLDKT